LFPSADSDVWIKTYSRQILDWIPLPRTMADTKSTALAASLERRTQQVIRRREIEGMIAEGRHIIIYDGRVLKADAWLKFHPGGDKAIKHMVGRDATDEINAYATPGWWHQTQTNVPQ
jgi:cytochrome b involved in lipid metabolism